MTDSKLTALTELTTPSSDDIIYAVDDPTGTPASRKLKLANTPVAPGTSGNVLTSDGSKWTSATPATGSGGFNQGFMTNGKIVPTVVGNNLTLTLQTLAGADPSVGDPVTVRINGTVRTITAALSVTKNAGVNWFNSGGVLTATKEIDYFAYLGYNATDGVVIGFARIPYARQYSDFSATSTNDKYCAISTISNAISTDYYEIIGRFAATLGATASFNWSVPTFTAINLINNPIFFTRILSYVPAWASSGTAPALGNGTLTGTYQILYNIIIVNIAQAMGSSTTYGTGSYNWTTPMTLVTMTIGFAYDLDSGTAYHLGIAIRQGATEAVTVVPEGGAGPWGQTAPQTWAVNDTLNIKIEYQV